MAETAAGGGSDDDSDQLVSIHEAAENCNVVQLQRALAAGGVLLRIELYMQHVTPHTQIGLNTALLQLARRRVVRSKK